MSRGNNKSNAAGMYRVAGFRALMVELCGSSLLFCLQGLDTWQVAQSRDIRKGRITPTVASPPSNG